MKKIIMPQNEIVYPEVTEKLPVVSWESEAIESLQSLERYTVLKALEEGKRLVKKVMEVAAKNACDNQKITKLQVQNAITEVLEEIELAKHPKKQTAS